MNYLKLKFWVSFFALILYLSNIQAQNADKTLWIPSGKTITIEQLESRIESGMDSLNYPGLSIAIINNNQLVYSNAFGVANTETKEKVTGKTIFQGASLSKPLFAYFIMKMEEEYHLNLDNPIYPYLATIFPKEAIEAKSFEAYKTITPRMVLSHTTGIPNWTNGKPISIAFKPGTDFSYSGEAYQHLGAAFALKMGIDWGAPLNDMIKRNATDTLGMNSSFYVWDDRFNTITARGHSENKMIPEIKKYKKVGPGFSLYTNASDYALFLLEMLNPKNISVSTRDKMLEEQIHFKENNDLFIETGQTGWGLGFAQKQTTNGLVHLHTGKNPGFESYAMFMPEHNYGLVMF
ncbi:MAG: serine hydrolase domain-containing protein [Bacteroidota bacterium]